MDTSKAVGAEETGEAIVSRGTQTDWTGERNGKPTGTVGTPTDDVGGRLTVTVDTETNQRIFRFAEQSEQLLPGLSDEITLDHICTKLPWRAFHVLSGVSRLWQHAIRSRQVYDARVRANSTETLVLLQHGRSDCYGIALYSMRENYCYRVPGIAHLETGIPQSSKCTAVDGKIYVLGGEYDGELSGNEVYELDLAGQKDWEQCEDMERSRKEFGLGVLDGKIYVCGGTFSEDDPVCGCEVYDPKEDVWSWIRPMTSIRFDHHVTALGGELFAYGGSLFDQEFFEWRDNREDWSGVGVNDELYDHIHDALFLEVYDPGQNSWKVVEPFGRQGLQRLFVARGKFHLMTSGSVYVLDGDVEKNVWTELHLFSLPLVRIAEVDQCPTLAVDDELLTMCDLPVSARDDLYLYKTCLLRSKGFGGKTKELVWEAANCPLSFEIPLSMCLIQL